MSTHNAPTPASSGGSLRELENFTSMESLILDPLSSLNAISQVFSEFALGVFRCISMPLDTLVRRKHGERHFSWYFFLGGTAWVGIFATGFVNVASMMGIPANNLIPHEPIFVVLFLWFLAYMFYQLIIRRQMPIKFQYSVDEGNPLPIFNYFPYAKLKDGTRNDPLIKQLYEPAAFFCVGVVTTLLVNAQVGSFFLLSSIAWFFKEYATLQLQRRGILKIIDSQIMGRYTQEILSGKPSESSSGLNLPMANNAPMRKQLKTALDAQKNKFSVTDTLDRQQPQEAKA